MLVNLAYTIYKAIPFKSYCVIDVYMYICMYVCMYVCMHEFLLTGGAHIVGSTIKHARGTWRVTEHRHLQPVQIYNRIIVCDIYIYLYIYLFISYIVL